MFSWFFNAQTSVYQLIKYYKWYYHFGIPLLPRNLFISFNKGTLTI